MSETLIAAFQKAEKGWHSVSSILVPYIAEVGRYNVQRAVLLYDCMALAGKRKVKVRISNEGRFEFKLA